MSSMTRKAALPLGAALLFAAVTTSPARAGSGIGGRQLEGRFCTNATALPKPGACIALTGDGATAQGYTGSPDRVLALRPGTYWITVTDTSAVHNFSLADPDGLDKDITTPAGTPGSVTVKVNLTHGTWVLFCDPHRAMGMYVDLEVGGVGQVG